MTKVATAVRAGAVVAGVGVAAGYAVYRAGGRRWRANEEQMVAAGLSLPADLHHHFVTADDGARLHVMERGAGPPVVLLHGVGLSGAIWVRQLRQLSDSHRVIAIDMRGHGQSVAGHQGYSIDRLADDLLVVLRALDVEHSVLAGHSMGGMVVLRLACRKPEELRTHVACLALVATEAGPVVAGPGHAWRAQRLASLTRRALRQPGRLGVTMRPHGDLASWAARLGFGQHPLPAQVELCRSLLSAMAPDAMAELIATVVAFDVRRDVGTIVLPTRIFVGTRDVLTPMQAARLLNRSIKGSTLVRYPGAGHMLMLERERELNAELTDMVRSLEMAIA